MKNQFGTIKKFMIMLEGFLKNKVQSEEKV